MSLPTTLNNISTANTAWISDFEYRHKSSVTGYEIYDLWKISHSNWFNVAAGYSNPDAYSIKVDTSTGVWSDNAPTTTPLVNASNSTYVILSASNGDELYRFTKPSYFSGPTVTAHTWVDLTENATVTTTDTVQASDFSFLKNDNSYTPSSMNLVSISNGYVYDYTQTDTALYTATIDSKSVSNFYLDTSWTSSPLTYNGRSTNSNRILNVLGKLPNTASFNFSTSIWNTTSRTFHNNNRYMKIRFYKTGSNASPTTDLHVYFYVYGGGNNIEAKFVGYTYEGDELTGYLSTNQSFTVGAQATMSHTFTIDGTDQIIDVPDWIYSDEIEGDNYTPPVSTTSNGGGKRRRYPIISTNLFDRQRSIFSIGLTHKDETLF